MLLYCLFINLFIGINCKFYVAWPFGITWWAWRVNVRFPAWYRGFYVYYLHEWPHHLAGKMWENADVSEPVFFQKYSSFVPAYMRGSCNDQGMDLRHLHYYSALKDWSKFKIISLLSSGNRKRYHNDRYHFYLAYLYNICLCSLNVMTSITCPDPCRKPDVCVTEKNVIQKSCRKVVDKDRKINLKEGDFNFMYGKLFRYDTICSCKRGFIWDRKKRRCDRIQVTCRLDRINQAVCQNGGKCVPLKHHEQIYDFLIMRCICTSAWTGYLCTEPADPCKKSKKLCGDFTCRRDVTSLTKGYQCVCTRGYRRYSSYEPRCVNINECVNMPCQHGGRCIDFHPDPRNVQSPLYKCKCIGGFTGTNCEQPPDHPTWGQWGFWSKCSVSCGTSGRVSRYRECTVAGRCDGMSRQTSTCSAGSGDGLVAVSCEFVGGGLESKDSLSSLQKAGVGWNAEEDRIIDDAFHWGEKLKSEQPEDRRWMLNQLEYCVSIVTFVLVGFIGLIFIVNIILLGPRHWRVHSFQLKD